MSELNPLVAWDELPVRVATELTRWEEERRIAGVSSFGFGGTNAHVVLESPAPEAAPGVVEDVRPFVVKVSGRTEAALHTFAGQLGAAVKDLKDGGLSAVAWAAGSGRADLSERAAVVAGSAAELVDGLARIAEGRPPADGAVRGSRPAGGPPRIGFVVPGGRGEGAAGTLSALYGRIDEVTATVDEVCAATGRPGPLPDDHALTSYAVATALGAWWRSVGADPDVIAGYGIGGYAAGALAGVFTLADGARLVAAADDPKALETVLVDIQLRPPAVEFMADAIGTPAGGGADVATPAYWLRQAAHQSAAPASSADALRTALTAKPLALVELGPGEAAATGAHRRLLESLARLWSEGVDVDWTRVNGPRPARVPKLPTYPFQRSTHWLSPAGHAAAPAGPGDTGVALRPRIIKAATGDTIGETRLSLAVLPFLEEHRVHGRIVVPGVVHLELVLRCAAEVLGSPVRIEDLALSRPLVLDDDHTATVQVVLGAAVSGRARARVFSAGQDGGWQQHLAADVVADPTAPPGPAGAVDTAGPLVAATTPATRFDAVRSRCTQTLAESDFYRRAWHPSFRLGPSFRLVKGAKRGYGVAVGTLVQPAPDAMGITAGIRPELLLLDACVQLVAAAAHSGTVGWNERPVHLGTGYESMAVHRPVTSDTLECTALLRDTTDDAVIGDITLTETDGTPVAELRGVSFRPVTPQTLSRMVAEQTTSRGDLGWPNALPAPEASALLAADAEARRQLVLDHLVRLLAGVRGSAPQEVHPDAPVIELADSLMMAELKTRADRDLNVEIPMEMLFTGDGLRVLADWIATTIEETAQEHAGAGEFRRTAEPEWAAATEPSAETAETAAGPAPTGPRARRTTTPARRLKAMTVTEMAERAELEASITATVPPQPAGTAPQTTLLTGATGYVGAFLLIELLGRRPGEVHCLVRADDPAHGLRRIRSNLEFYGLDAGPDLDRIVPVVGDLAQPLLGLTPDTFHALHAQVGSIVHCGGLVKWTYPYKGLADANVGGTREVLRLATAGAVRPVHFISTVGVFSSTDYTADLVHESDDLHHSGSLVVGYAQTKWVAEQMVRTAHIRGVPVTIHRINTGGHSRTGAFNRLDHLTMMLKGCIEAGIAPQDVQMPVQPAPIDYVAAAVVELAARPELDGRTFHLVNDRPLTWQQLFDRVEEFGYPLQRLPFDEWKERVTGRRSGTMALLGLAPFLNDTVDHVRLARSASDETRAALAGTGLSCPPLDTELVHTYLRSFISSGFVDPPAR
ncbi:thioester reductase domain-containing protein [Streptomyces inhibens]